jgi:outer membrane receptor protein involved in Fe transport
MNSTHGLPSALRRLLLAQTCAMMAVSFSWAQTAPTTPTTTAPSARSEEVIQLSPFEVKTEANGYYSPNTMSGTRINSNIQDLASSITVVTKTQMQDFAMLNINDVFLYAGNTEGIGTYTAGTAATGIADRNGSVQDNVQVDPVNSNRIRGIAPANITLGNIQTMGRVPIDPIDIDSIEISRGPNANVFGLGNPSGTVNMVPSSANLSRNFAQATARADSYDGYRTTLDLNRVLWDNLLALRVSGVFQHDGYVRKPSGANTVRYNGMIKFRPFKSTTITGSVSFYRYNGNRPNAIPPRDNISYWIASGKPTWDPTTQQIHINGVTVGTFTSTTYNGPDYFSATLLGGSHSQMFIDQNGLSYWSAPQAFNNTSALWPGTTVRGPTAGGQAVRFLQTTGISGGTGTSVHGFQPLWITSPTISDKSVYDWSSINLSAPNRLMDRTLTTNLQVEQMFLNTSQQLLVGQVAFMREDSKRYQRNLLGLANSEGQSGQLEVDPNEKLLDGTPNPYFLRPFIATDKPPTLWLPAKWDTYRAQLVYKLDLTEQKNFLKWLGVQDITAYDEYKYQINRQYRFREAMLDAKTWLTPGLYRSYQSVPAGTPTVQGITNGLFRYYVGDNSGYNVDYAPTDFNNNGTYNFVWGRAAQGTLPALWNSEPTTLGLAAADKTGGTNNTKQIIKTVGAVLQSHFLNDALVVTLGTREDRVYSKFGYQTAAGAVLLAPDGMNIDYNFVNSWQGGDYAFNGGKTTNVQYVLRPFRELPLIKRLDEKGGAGQFFAGVLRGLSLNFNHANSFIAATPAQDLYLQPLPNTTGVDKSYGLGLDLFDGKIVLLVTHYQTLQKDIRNGDANTISQRVIRTDLPLVGQTAARFVLQNVAGGTTASYGPNNNQFGWIKAMNPTWTNQQVADELATEMAFPTALQAALISPSPPIAATNDIAARGTEVELNANPTKYWTISCNFTDTQAYIKNVSSTLQHWIDQRMPIWTTIVDRAASIYWTPAQLAAEPQHLWWTHNYGGTQTPQQNFQAFVASPYALIKALEGQANPQTRRYNVRLATSYRLAGITDQRILKNFTVGAAVRWEDKGAIGFYGVPDANGIYQSVNVNTPVYDKAHTYLDLVVGYRTKLFGGRIPASFQLNVRDLTESGHLQPIAAYPDGTINTYRIVDPRQFILSATFDL